MDWSKGYSVSYYLTFVDTETWCDLERAEISEGSINRSYDGLRESASVTCKQSFTDVERWVRIYMDINQSGSRAHNAIFTGLATSPSFRYNGNITTNSYECYSVLKPVEDIVLLRGWFVNAGASGARVILDLLKNTLAPASIPEEYINDESQYVKDYIVAEDGETALSMIERILLSIKWRLRIKGDGSISVEPCASKSSYIFDPLYFDIIEPEVTVSSDWFSIPNVFCAISEGLTAIAKDENESSIVSIPNRKREVWMVETNCDLSDKETIEEYAKRRLNDEQKMFQTVSYTRRYVDDILPGDIITLNYPKQNVIGDYEITSQSITLGYSGATNEEVMVYER